MKPLTYIISILFLSSCGQDTPRSIKSDSTRPLYHHNDSGLVSLQEDDQEDPIPSNICRDIETTLPFVGGPLRVGDANLDGIVDIKDKNIVLDSMNAGLLCPTWEDGNFNSDKKVDSEDLSLLYDSVARLRPGDLNLDRCVNAWDIGMIIAAGKYKTQFKATYEEGDISGGRGVRDGVVDSFDIDAILEGQLFNQPCEVFQLE